MKPNFIRGLAYGIGLAMPLVLRFEFNDSQMMVGYIAGAVTIALYFYLRNVAEGLETHENR